MQISHAAEQLIVEFEISSPAYYTSRLQNPVWPGGASGVTIGIGYDLGQHTAEQLRQDWSGLLDAPTLAGLSALCAIKGDGARIRIAGCHHAVVPLEAAEQVFLQKSLPDYVRHTVSALPNAEKLSPDSLGALTSISYNRGWGGWGMTDDRHSEMHAVHTCMAAQDFTAIPALIRQMKRLWQDTGGRPLPGCEGLPPRREREAALFETGLATLNT